MRSANVPLSPSSALQQTNRSPGGASTTVCHLIPAGNPAPPRPRRPDSTSSSQISPGVIVERAPEAGEPARRLVLVGGDRVDDADAGEGDPLLAGQGRDLVGRAERERMRGAVDEAGREQRRDVGRRDRPVRDPAVGRRDLDERLEPQHAAGSGAHDPHRDRRAPGPRLSISSATASAPTARADASRGTYTTTPSASPPPLWRDAVMGSGARSVSASNASRPGRVDAPVHDAVDHHRRTERAVPQAEHRVERHRAVGGGLAEPDPEVLLGVRRPGDRPRPLDTPRRGTPSRPDGRAARPGSRGRRSRPRAPRRARG